MSQDEDSKAKTNKKELLSFTERQLSIIKKGLLQVAMTSLSCFSSCQARYRSSKWLDTENQ